MLRSAAVALWLALAAPALAQETTHRLPVGSAGHVLELALDRAPGAPPGVLAVVVAEAPAWLDFDAPRAEASAEASAEAEGRTSVVARLAFGVGATAAFGTSGAVVLHVVGADGAVVATHTVRVEAASPAVLALLPVRPNPSVAGAAAVVGWSLPEAGQVRVSVFDALGREVAVLAEGEAAAGGYEARLGRLAAGAYVVRLVAGRAARVQRLAVVR